MATDNLLQRSLSPVYILILLAIILTAETSEEVQLQNGMSVPVALGVWGSRCWSQGHISLHCPGLCCVHLFRPSQTENPLTDRKHNVITDIRICSNPDEGITGVTDVLSLSLQLWWMYFSGLSPALTGSNHPVTEAGDTHWLQLNPGLSVGVI